jgi:hypothetical protein
MFTPIIMSGRGSRINGDVISVNVIGVDRARTDTPLVRKSRVKISRPGQPARGFRTRAHLVNGYRDVPSPFPSRE